MGVQVTEVNNLITISYYGDVGLNDVISAYRQLVGMPSFDSAPLMLVDTSQITSVDYEPDNFEEHAIIARSTSKARRSRPFEVGIVVTSQNVLDAIFKLNKITAEIQPDWTRHVFGELDEAKAWAYSKLSTGSSTVTH